MQGSDQATATLEPLWQRARFAELEPACLYEILRLRQRVFCIEQNCLYQDLDGRDPDAHHLWCSSNGRLVAYLRALPPAGATAGSSLGRIVTAPEVRGLGLGRKLVARGVRFNRGQWPNRPIDISAQIRLQQFYADFGFVAHGAPYQEDGIPHIAMQLPGEAKP